MNGFQRDYPEERRDKPPHPIEKRETILYNEESKEITMKKDSDNIKPEQEDQPAAKKRRGSWIPPLLCRLFGTVILLIVIVVTASIVVPQIRGFEVYHIVSGSMEPEIPVGSAVYINTNTPPEDVEEKDIIAFESGDSLVVHRVTRNQIVEGYFKDRKSVV